MSLAGKFAARHLVQGSIVVSLGLLIILGNGAVNLVELEKSLDLVIVAV